MVKNAAEKQWSFLTFLLKQLLRMTRTLVPIHSLLVEEYFYSEIFSKELLNDFCSMQVGEEVEQALQNFAPKVGSRSVIGH
jgi:hypothetical protein